MLRSILSGAQTGWFLSASFQRFGFGTTPARLIKHRRASPPNLGGEFCSRKQQMLDSEVRWLIRRREINMRIGTTLVFLLLTAGALASGVFRPESARQRGAGAVEPVIVRVPDRDIGILALAPRAILQRSSVSQYKVVYQFQF